MGDQFKGFLSWVVFVARALAVSVEVFLHRSIGERYLGTQALAAVVLLLLYPIFWEGHDAEPVLWMLAAYLFLCAASRAAGFARRARGEVGEHSYYTGRPRLMALMPRANEARVKGVAEPALVMLVGGIVGEINAPLGSYLMLAGMGLAVSVQTTLRYERSRLLDVNDALIDQRRAAERWRSGRRN